MGLKAYLSVSYKADQLAVAYIQSELKEMGVEVVRYRTTRTSPSTNRWDDEDTKVLKSCDFVLIIPPATPEDHRFLGETLIGAGQNSEINMFGYYPKIYVLTQICKDNLASHCIRPLVDKEFLGVDYTNNAAKLLFNMRQDALDLEDVVNICMAISGRSSAQPKNLTSDLDQALAELRSIGQVSYRNVPKFHQAPTRSDMPELDEALSVLRREAPEIAAQAEKEYRVAATAIKDIDSEDFFTLEDTSLLAAAPPVLLKY